MKFTPIASALGLAVMTLGMTGSAHAANAGIITFNGSVTAASCTSSNQTVSLPAVAASAFSGTAGSTPTGSTAQAFGITVTCPSASTSASVAFDTSSGVDASNYLTNAGTATGVAIAIYNGSGTTNAIANPQTGVTLNGSHQATFSYNANYVETAASVTAGTVTGSVGFTVTYN